MIFCRVFIPPPPSSIAAMKTAPVSGLPVIWTLRKKVELTSTGADQVMVRDPSKEAPMASTEVSGEAPKASPEASGQAGVGPKPQVAVAEPVPLTGRRPALRKLAREMTDAELNSSGVTK